MEETESVEEYLARVIRERLVALFAEYPWWCLFCGAGGNYDGDRPDEYPPPPLEHVCPPGWDRVPKVGVDGIVGPQGIVT